VTLERLRASLADRYRLERELGQGGMATVYLAQDLKHQRQVAIKVLKPELAAVLGAERFVQEIKTTAALSHPHILPLFDSGTADGFLYYVMPYIQGETLRSRLDREKQLGVDEAVRITREVADALDYAHRNGVIHRDIKPENILLHDGRPMVADFGIALAVSAAAGGRMTETGLSLGTPHYMSPEQATAEKEITARSDVYSLASVLYEMLAGNPPHTGASAQQIIMKIIAEPAAEVTTLRKAVPPNVAAALAQALEKLPADRFATAKAFADALANPAFSSTMAATAVRPRLARSRRAAVFHGAAWALLGAVLAWAGLRFRDAETTGSPRSEQVTFSGTAGSPAVSPDGHFVAYLDTRCPQPPLTGGCVSLDVVEVGSARPVRILTGAVRLSSPRWTHDGSALVVSGVLDATRAGLFVVPRLGGTPRRLADAAQVYDTHASADSVALVARDDSGSVLRVLALGSGAFVGAPIRLGITPIDLAWSPDGRLLAAATFGGPVVLRRDDGARVSQPLDAHARRTVRWSVDGRDLLMFQWGAGSNDDLIALRVDAAGRLGPPRMLITQVSTLGAGQFDVARRTGRLVLGSGSLFTDLWSFDVAGGKGRGRRLTQGSFWYGPPVLTADGRTLYYLRADPLGDNLYRAVDGAETAVTGDRQIVYNAVHLSPDERSATFESIVDSTMVLMVVDLASGATRRVPRAFEDFGWMLAGQGDLLWLNRELRSLRVTDSAGANPRTVAEGRAGDAPGALAWWSSSVASSGYGMWAPAPDGRSVVLLLGSLDTLILARVSLASSEVTVLQRFAAASAELGVTGWSGDGMIRLARADPVAGTTTLVTVDAGTGVLRPDAVLPARCDPRSVSYAPVARRAACTVEEARTDVVMYHGLKP
jgi:tRNA A-37 threonylcarbamoyl transferase component Bud32